MKQQHYHQDSDSDSDGPPEEVGRGPHSRSAPSDEDEQPSSSGRSHSSSSGADSDDSDADLDEQEQVLEQRLAEYPLEVVTQQMRDGQGPTGAIARAAAAAAKQQVFHRETKNRPQQLSSKRPVSRFREVIQVPKQGGKDPRFDSTIGGKPFHQDEFARRYKFLYDDVLPQERADLKKQMRKEKGEGKRRELQSHLTRLQQMMTEEKTRRKAAELEQGWKSEEKAAVAAGKKPFFLKKSEKRKRELLAKYEDLKSAGQLDKYMAKRRKKNAAKDHRYVPSGRRGGE